eukprot:GHRR01023175.1.p1 GENE.GHRR01023175.1~~GHRR01023175.1.p1  ORF type:complete len:193 (+),score=28.16 GHRR01023175.1:430-1008(+)
MQTIGSNTSTLLQSPKISGPTRLVPCKWPAQSLPAQQYDCPGIPAIDRKSIIVSAAKGASNGKPSSKGFGAAKPQKLGAKDTCPCGSNLRYKECCKSIHTGVTLAPSVEATVKARFSAILKKDVSFLLQSTHPDFHTFHYGTEPGGALRALQDDLWNTVEHYEYDNLKILKVVHSIQYVCKHSLEGVESHTW